MPASSQPLAAAVPDSLKPFVQPTVIALDKAFDAVGEANVIAYFQGLYDEYGVPLDIPGVPAALEPFVDQIARQAIAAAIKAAHAAIHQEAILPPAPVTPAVAPPAGSV